MKTLILNIDRDNDYGMKAGITGPIIGYNNCYRAATALITKDPEDSDSNALFGALKHYQELKDKGENVEIALITGDSDVGEKSDEILSLQLDEVLNMEHYDDLILISDGAEDDYITPIIASRIKIRYVKHIIVRHNENIESTYYYIVKAFKDKKVSRKFTVPVGLLLLSYGIALLIFTVYSMIISRSYVIIPSSGAIMLVTIVIGSYFILKDADIRPKIVTVLSALKEYSEETKISMLSYVVSFFIIIIGIAYTYEQTLKTVPLLNKILVFLAIISWWVYGSYLSRSLFEAFDISFISKAGRLSKIWYGVSFSIALELITYGMINYIRYVVGFIKFSSFMIYFVYLIAGIIMALVTAVIHKYRSTIKSKQKSLFGVK
ncbi:MULTISPECIES: DUF373 family protein [Acidiplasma]|jgi:putative membrane protein|uniref:DUF373 family protein n=2 Tax=Acidiplasma TaxID=507753 RepID=A0A0Q0RF20_9ARCH|nr:MULTISPECIES: DUF373 family protein [Acidiplasma]KJE48804.1 hypothetical protein TZ01_05795 [Acidiplasma sp. MBA-1]KPV47667.1 hypothetical protein SE19_00085 [Acidiplasma aeolicum]KQB33682.1 hypothetical protein AOG55_02255 [Acidiplasma cupricumulans]KQB36524.1 hypothetical protein AOG54_02075 [Acidiplasma aeolicum]WMT54192.1 MAG: DUF373 family protein [Acidiplasma sp.]